MHDTRMDVYEAIAFGRFTAAQIQTLLLGLDVELDTTLKLVANRVSSASDALELAMIRSGMPEFLLHRAPSGQPDPLREARDALRGVVHDAETGRDGFMFASRILQGESLSTTLRRTPAKLLLRLEHARVEVEEAKATFPAHEHWLGVLERARQSLVTFDATVRAARAERRGIPSEVFSAWQSWQRTYAAAKHIVIGTLAGCEQLALVREVFDDLADETEARLSQLPPPPNF
ncbi:MAG TPA: hypothetical protein PKA58_20050 [Polyangium sp.]|jgi:hypothetical protein|nr:hypothetical protein [Polyangium sp.]